MTTVQPSGTSVSLIFCGVSSSTHGRRWRWHLWGWPWPQHALTQVSRSVEVALPSLHTASWFPWHLNQDLCHPILPCQLSHTVSAHPLSPPFLLTILHTQQCWSRSCDLKKKWPDWGLNPRSPWTYTRCSNHWATRPWFTTRLIVNMLG